MHTIFVGLGGTGTQIATAIGNLYPLLKLAKISDEPFDMFIVDKDTTSGIFQSCISAQKRFSESYKSLPFEKLPPYELKYDVYQQMQNAAGFRDKEYTIMDLIGNDKLMKELASMCWTELKQSESIRDGNNRDPSRGSVDVRVCLEHLEETSLFSGIQNFNEREGVENLRLVLLGGATGGMGSSLIVPLAEKIRNKYPTLRIDLVVLGTYFEIPNGPAKNSRDHIGTTFDSFYRAADQLEELSGVVGNDWRVFYAAMPCFDDIAGEFKKNGANRSSHLVELVAALAAFAIEKEAPGLYVTALGYDEQKKPEVLWDEIPFGFEIKKHAKDLLYLISIMSSKVLTILSDNNTAKNDPYIKKYFKKPKAAVESLERMKDILEILVKNLKPYFVFWDEIQQKTALGRKDEKQIVSFFKDDKGMETLRAILASIEDAKSHESMKANDIPLYMEMWSDFANDIKPNRKKIDGAKDESEILYIMIEDIYNKLSSKEEK